MLILYYTDSTVTFSVKDEEIDFDHVSVSFEDGEEIMNDVHELMIDLQYKCNTKKE